MEDSITNIINRSVNVNKSKLHDYIRPIINEIRTMIMDSKNEIISSCEVDKNNNNGFIIDFDIVNNIFNNVLKENIIYKDVVQSEKNDSLIYGHEMMDYGNCVLISDGNAYITLEMILRSILSGNTLIIVNDGYMYGVNSVLVSFTQSVLEHFKIDKNLIQLYITTDYESVLNEYHNIDLVICIGNHGLQRRILNISKNKTIVSGYENFDIYIEDDKNLEFINKIIESGVNIQLYVSESLSNKYENAIVVSDIEEAIAQINYNGSSYATSIFTSDKESASHFINSVKSSIVLVNTSPTIERIIDIKQSDLMIEKTIIYPLSFKFDSNHDNINIGE